MLHLAILRSPMAHARITSIDVAPALAAKGVVAAFSGRDVADVQGSLPCAWPVTEDMVHPDRPPIAVDEVRFMGEAVAVVAARSRAAALDALAAIEVDYEPLPAVLDMEAGDRRRRRPGARRQGHQQGLHLGVRLGRGGHRRRRRRRRSTAPRWSSAGATCSSG